MAGICSAHRGFYSNCHICKTVSDVEDIEDPLTRRYYVDLIGPPPHLVLHHLGTERVIGSVYSPDPPHDAVPDVRIEVLSPIHVEVIGGYFEGDEFHPVDLDGHRVVLYAVDEEST